MDEEDSDFSLFDEKHWPEKHFLTSLNYFISIAEDEKNALLLERRKLKGMVAAQKRTGGGFKKGRSGKKGKKKDFASVALEEDGNSVSFKGSDDKPKNRDLQVKAAEKDSGLKKQASFRRHVSGDGKAYFSNVETNETVWELPNDANLV